MAYWYHYSVQHCACTQTFRDSAPSQALINDTFSHSQHYSVCSSTSFASRPSPSYYKNTMRNQNSPTRFISRSGTGDDRIVTYEGCSILRFVPYSSPCTCLSDPKSSVYTTHAYSNPALPLLACEITTMAFFPGPKSKQKERMLVFDVESYKDVEFCPSYFLGKIQDYLGYIHVCVLGMYEIGGRAGLGM